LKYNPWNFVNFPDFITYDHASYFEHGGLFDLLSMDYKIAYYPSLIRLFFTNMTHHHNTKTDFQSLKTLVKDTNIELTSKSIDKILQIPYKGLKISYIEMTDEDVLSQIFLPGKGLPMANKL